MEKSALIVSYYFPPCNGAPPWRAYSWAKHFHEFGIKPTVITRHWKENVFVWDEMILDSDEPMTIEEKNEFTVYRLPSKKSFFFNAWKKYFSRLGFLDKPYFFLLQLIGFFSSEVNAALTFKSFLKEHIRERKYHYIILTVPPRNIILLPRYLKKFTDAFIVLDYRDLFNNLRMNNNYHPSMSWRLKDVIYDFHQRRFLKYADAITTIVPAFADELKRLSAKPVEVIYNGYEDDLFSTVEEKMPDKFTVSCIGSIYPDQDLSIMIPAFTEFLKDKNDDVQIKFVGAEVLKNVSQKIKNALPFPQIIISGRVSKERAVFETRNAHVLYFMAWPGYRGFISTKIFD